MNKQRREGEGSAPKEIPSIHPPYHNKVSHADPKCSVRKGIRKLSMK